MRITAAMIVMAGCASAPVAPGSAMPLNMAPAPPLFVTGYDFDLLGVLHGEKCVSRRDLETAIHWTTVPGIDKLSDDKLTRAAIAAAAYEATAALDTVDAFVATRVIATARGSDVICAKVSGRGIRLKKYEGSMPLPKVALPEPDFHK